MTHQQLLDMKRPSNAALSTCTSTTTNPSDLSESDSLHVRDLYQLDALEKKTKKEHRDKKKKKQKSQMKEHKKKADDINMNGSIVSWNRSASNHVNNAAAQDTSASTISKKNKLLLLGDGPLDSEEDKEP